MSKARLAPERMNYSDLWQRALTLTIWLEAEPGDRMYKYRRSYVAELQAVLRELRTRGLQMQFNLFPERLADPRD